MDKTNHDSKQLGWRDNRIRDGFTQSGYIKEEEGVHGELEFMFRPMIPEESHVSQSKTERLLRIHDKEHKAIQHMAKDLATRVTEWSDDDPITVDTLRRTRPALLWKLYRVVTGEDASDIKDVADDDSDELPPLNDAPSEMLGK